MVGNLLTRDKFIALTIKHERRVRLFVMTLYPRQCEIDEILQNSWLVAWGKLDKFRYRDVKPDEEFVRWMCSIARYEVASYRRKNQSVMLLDDSLVEKLAAIQIDKAEYFEARRDALLACVEHLSPRDKEVLRRRYQEGVSVKDLAEWIGRSVEAVYKSLNRIRRSLQICIERKLKHEGN